MHDEKTTEIELPSKTIARSNIVRVNFTERRKTSRAYAPARPTPGTNRPVTGRRLVEEAPELSWKVRLAALIAILALSLFVL